MPLAVSGALLFSFLGFTTLNIYSQVGLITLVGLVAKNGILIVQFANHLQETGKDKLAAVIEAAGTRLRPILMTTAATVVGHFPLVLATGPGAGARNSIGIMLVSGMIIGTLFTLFVVPSIYMLVARKRERPSSRSRGRRAMRGVTSWRRRYEREVCHERSDHSQRAVVGAVVLAALLAASRRAQDATRRRQRSAGRTLPLTLDDAVRRAVENNPELAIVRLGTEVEAARVGESRSAFTPVFSTSFGRSSTVTPPSNLLLGERGVDVNDWFSSTGVRQRLPWGSGTWSVSWDTSRTTTNNPISSFDPSLQSGFQVAFSQPLLKDRAIDAARQQYDHREAEPGELGAAVPRSRRADGRRRQAGVLDVQGDARQRRPCSSGRSSWPRSSRARTRFASMPDRFRRSISCRPKPRWRSGART